MFEFITKAKKPRVRKPDPPPSVRRQKDPNDYENTPGLIMGQMPDSVEEWRVYLALVSLKWEFDYQVSIDGGRRVRGGQVIDFIVYQGPRKIPVFVQGAYWHNIRTESEDLLKQAAAAHAFGTQPVLLEEHELETVQEARSALLSKVGT